MLTVAVWIGGLAALSAVAKQVHDDVPQALARKLPLLQLKPRIVFAGDSRTHYQIDAALAAKLAGLPVGKVVNIAYEAGEPLAFLAVMRRYPELFADAQVVTSVAPSIFNEGVKQATAYPQNAFARLGVAQQLVTFLPMRVGTVIRFIREAFASRLTADQDLAGSGTMPPDYGYVGLKHFAAYNWPKDLGSHPLYENWNVNGPKSQFEIGALCDMARLTQRLTVMLPPWSPRYDRGIDTVWSKKDAEEVALLTTAGERCHFDVLNIPAVPGLTAEDYSDELHLNESGVPLYTRHVMSHLKS
ncbi:MAG: hypothetical protein ABWY18_11675 [Tardiphaga sp.]